MADQSLIIRKGELVDLQGLQQLFVETVFTVCKDDYTQQQLNAWTSGVKNRQRWFDIATKQVLLVAEENEVIVGFCSLAEGGYLDMLYVHNKRQGRGVARKLFLAIEQEALKRSYRQITSDVSITAQPFFQQMGFVTTMENEGRRDDVILKNYKMVKKLL